MKSQFQPRRSWTDRLAFDNFNTTGSLLILRYSYNRFHTMSYNIHLSGDDLPTLIPIFKGPIQRFDIPRHPSCIIQRLDPLSRNITTLIPTLC